jgi:hypothetical protein
LSLIAYREICASNEYSPIASLATRKASLLSLRSLLAVSSTDQDPKQTVQVSSGSAPVPLLIVRRKTMSIGPPPVSPI